MIYKRISVVRSACLSKARKPIERSVLVDLDFRTVALSVAFGFGLASGANAQFVDNGGQAGSADTSAFGQTAEFSNITTNFDGVDLQVQRLIRDPKDKSKLRLIGQIVNTNSDNRWIQWFRPFPKLTDELGNEYMVQMWTGVDACRDNQKEDFRWGDDIRNDCPGNGASTLLAPSLPVTFSISFVPSDSGTFDADLASMATYLNVSLSLILATGDLTYLSFEERGTKVMPYQVVIPQMPVPSL